MKIITKNKGEVHAMGFNVWVEEANLNHNEEAFIKLIQKMRDLKDMY